MGILDFLSKKSPAAPAPAGATETTAAPADALKAEITSHGLDASRINIAVVAAPPVSVTVEPSTAMLILEASRP